MAEPGVGRIIDNKYEIIARIGQGGMSYVWLGKDKRLDKLWAIKEFRPSTISSQGSANRQAIIDEANFIKRLDHPAIPRVVDIIDTGASIFVVMDFIDGTALDKVLKQQGFPFEQERVIDWGIQLCEVFEYLHGLKNPVVYRDMKPANVMLRGDESVKLIDFGISMELLPSGPSDTRIIGTRGYGAPEQVDKETHRLIPVDTRADIYALGTTLYSLVTGHVPRMCKDASTGKRVVDFEMRPIREWNGQLSEGLEHIIQKATNGDPADRYQTAAEMRYDLEHYEELTREYRAVQQRKVNGFWHRVTAAGVSLALGVVCLGVSALVRNSSYDALVHEASVASAEEQRGNDGSAEASEAEDLLARAIEISPERIDTYQRLLEVYEEDSRFTTTEARRWNEIWQAHGQTLAADPQYGKLNYDVGVLYLVYYDYMDARGNADGEGTTVAATGQGAIENSKRSQPWFQRAKDNPGSLTDDERDMAERLTDIASFYELAAKASREGREASKDYADFWETLEAMVVGNNGSEQSIADSEPILRLRIYQVAFESVSSSTYLTGFRYAGIGRSQAETMLSAACEGTRSLGNFVMANPDSAQAMYDEITSGEDDARANIARVYSNTLVQDGEQGEEA